MRSRGRVVLIYPRGFMQLDPRRRFYTTSPSVGLGYVASALRDAGHDVYICDLQVDAPRDALALVRDKNPDLVGVSLAAFSMKQAEPLMRSLRSVTEAPLACGGPHATNWSERLLRSGISDLAVLGEGDRALGPVMDALLNGAAISEMRAAGVAVIDDEGRHVGEPPPRIDDLDELPFPAFDLMKLDRYSSGPNRSLPGHTIPMMTTRGCVFECLYCDSATTFGHTVRYRSGEGIRAEIRHWKKALGAPVSVHVWDDTFTVNREHAAAAAEVFADEGISWSCTTRPDRVDQELLAHMASCGCMHIYFGAESFDVSTLKRLNRTHTPSAVRASLAAAKRAGITTSAGVIVGLPFQTLGQMRADISALFETNTDFPTVNVFRAYGERALALYEGKQGGEQLLEKAYHGRPMDGLLRRAAVNSMRLFELGRFHITKAVVGRFRVESQGGEQR